MEALFNGFTLHDLGLFLNRVVPGVFFLSYRFRWVYDPTAPDRKLCSPTRRARLINRLSSCGLPGHPVLAATVAIGEILAGLALVVGLLAVPAAIGLVLVMVFANACTPKEEIPFMKPVDRLDYVSCYLRLVEPLYLVMCLNVVLMGPGQWSLDALVWSWLSQ